MQFEWVCILISTLAQSDEVFFLRETLRARCVLLAPRSSRSRYFSCNIFPSRTSYSNRLRVLRLNLYRSFQMTSRQGSIFLNNDKGTIRFGNFSAKRYYPVLWEWEREFLSFFSLLLMTLYIFSIFTVSLLCVQKHNFKNFPCPPTFYSRFLASPQGRRFHTISLDFPTFPPGGYPLRRLKG